MKRQIQWLLGSIAAKQNSFMEQLGTLSVGNRPRRGGGDNEDHRTSLTVFTCSWQSTMHGKGATVALGLNL